MAIWDMVTTILGLGAMVVTGDTVTEDGTVDGMVVITHIILITHIIPITVMGMGMGMDIGNMGIHRDEGVIMTIIMLTQIPLDVPIAPL